MKNTVKVEAKVGDKTLTLESGVLAQQAAGALTVQIGETVLFSAVTGSKKPREGIDFFPLQIEYREKFYSAGIFPGGYFKREARPSEKEILTMRVTDRPIRPLFPEGYHNDVQINNMVMSADGIHEPDMQSINAASAALWLSEIPFLGPIAAVRIGKVDGELVVEPTHQQLPESELNLVYVGTREKTMMIEGDAAEISEEEMVAAMRLAHESIQPIIDAQYELRKKLGLPDKVVEVPAKETTYFNRILEAAGEEMSTVLTISGKIERQEKLHDIREKLNEQLTAEFPDMTENDFFHAFDDAEIEVVRRNVLQKDQRIDGRGLDELRPLEGEVGVLPRTHGSSMFQRGETQAVATITLGTGSDSQSMDSITGGAKEKKFLLHYNFPPYSVGEAGRLGMTSRREIGHGNLAERSLVQVMPKEYPYSVRIVSEVMSSNGSTSMASVCSGTLALMDAGVPIAGPVAGISAGLFTSADQSKLVMDIIGSEDHCGDMDFKVCGTRKGITGFQVDMKINGLNWEQVEGAFAMTLKGRLQILDFMDTIIPAPREEMSEHAPRVEQVKIDPEKIGALIGPGGKIIKGIQETHGVKIDIEEDGTVSIYSNSSDGMADALKMVQSITAEAEPGRIYSGIVKAVKPFGAFVEILPGKEGLLHISELADHRVEQVEDILKIGDKLDVKCLEVDDKGKIRLSRRAAMQEQGVTEDA